MARRLLELMDADTGNDKQPSVFQFSQPIDPAKISATLKDGILEVHILKTESTTTKVEVK